MQNNCGLFFFFLSLYTSITNKPKLMYTNSAEEKSNYRWVICSLLLFATTINYLDKQVLSMTIDDYIRPDFHWSDFQYGLITGFFSLFYAVACLFAGRFMDWIGTRRGYIYAICIWSVGACLHAFCGLATMGIVGIDSPEEMRALEAGSTIALAVASTSVWLFLVCRAILALGEGGNFPAAIKTTAEYFPKKDRAFATSIFNAGSSIGALTSPLLIPLLAELYGWQMAFIIIGALGFIWMFCWMYAYERPERNKHVNQEELTYILQDEEISDAVEEKEDEKPIPILRCLTYRQTWSFVLGKFFTDGVWWFYLYWAPSYFSTCGYSMKTTTGKFLVFTLYAIVTILSFCGGYLPKYFVEKRSMNPYTGRMRAMLIFAFFPLAALFAQPMQDISIWFPAIFIGIAGAGHQAWSANIFSTIGDMFPKSTVATITGMGNMAGGIAAWAISIGAGLLFDYAEEQGEAFSFFGICAKPAGYMIVFCDCAVTYIIAWCFMKTLVPTYKPIKV